MVSGHPSTVLNDISDGVPRRTNEFARGLVNGQRNIQYAPENGITKGCEGGRFDRASLLGIGSTRIGIGAVSGHKITPGNPPGTLSAGPSRAGSMGGGSYFLPGAGNGGGGGFAGIDA